MSGGGWANPVALQAQATSGQGYLVQHAVSEAEAAIEAALQKVALDICAAVDDIFDITGVEEDFTMHTWERAWDDHRDLMVLFGAEGVLTLSPDDMAQLEAVYRIPAANPKRKNHTSAENAQMRQQSKQVAAAVVPVARAQQAVPLTAHLDFNAGEVQFRTMYKEPPEFYIQKHFPWRGMNKAREVPQDRDDILALRT